MIVQYMHRETLNALPACAECGGPVTDGRHTSSHPEVPCRDGFPAGPTGCAAPDLHHLYQLPSSFLDTEPVPEDSLPDWAR